MDKAGELVVAVVGLGVGEQHAHAYAGHPAVRQVLLVDLDPARAMAVAKRVAKSAIAGTFAEIMSDQSVAIVSIASFDDAHFEQVAAALGAGKHVFVEKPLCRTLAELAQIKRLWAGAGGRLKLGSNLVLRAAPLYVWLRARVADGDLGDLYAFDGDYLYGRLEKVTHGWRRDVKDYSVMQGGGIHMIDLMLWVSRQRPHSVTAAGSRFCSRGTGFQYDDFCAALLRFESGMVARITANYGCVHRHQHVMRVFGSRKSFLYDDAGARMHESRDPAAPATVVARAPLPATKGDLIPAFVRSVVDNTDQGNETQDIFDGICVAIACDRAALSGQVEKVEYV